MAQPGVACPSLCSQACGHLGSNHRVDSPRKFDPKSRRCWRITALRARMTVGGDAQDVGNPVGGPERLINALGPRPQPAREATCVWVGNQYRFRDTGEEHGFELLSFGALGFFVLSDFYYAHFPSKLQGGQSL